MNTVISVLKALSEKNRLRIYSALMHHKELCACQLIELLEVSGATISRHLSQLVNAGLIQSRKDGRWIFYYLNDTTFRAQVADNWLHDTLSTSEEIKKDLIALEKIIKSDREELCRKQRGEACCPIK